ncbi:TonB-dependent receptor [Asticcacaulis sp. BYS171W]|uniref:TonB-dependent receptor n=1 Tax=Asticcacaulis aquaticus TaxID=2984212 RepID=A0ABT5HWN6_9CAUL|nr:TonB-dependent receptor [Asticcacaulis aquaticus]MDC7684463.1 TonB-dependent receptor [Asticcacaulis aquaticus]
MAHHIRKTGLAAAASALAIVWASGAAFAAEADVSPTAEPTTEVVITASSTKLKLVDAPASVSVVTQEQLHERPVRDLTEILNRTEGVTMNRAGNQRTIQLRGLGSAYTLFMIDGKRVSSTNAMFRGNDFDAGWVPVEAIQRVEVVRGPMSSLYGSDAIGGVVNIITKPVGDEWSGSVSADYILQENQDAGDAYKVGFFAAGPLVQNQLGLKVYGGYNRRERDKGQVNPVATVPGFADKREQYLDGTLVWTPDAAQTIDFNLGYNRLNHDNFPMERKNYAVTHKGTFGFGETLLRLSGDTIKNEIGNVTGQVNPNEAENQQLEGRITRQFAQRYSVTLGAEWRKQALTDPANLKGLPGTPTYGKNPEAEVTQTAVFFEGEIRLTDDFRITLGDRYDDHENFGGHHSPRAYLVWHITPQWTLKTGVSEAFRAPTLLQNSPNWGSVSCGSATTGCFIIGSTELEPETASSKEIGISYRGKAITGGVTFFETDLKNMIDITSRTRDVVLAPTYPNFVGFLPDGRPIFRYQNIAKVKSKGVETHLSVDFSESVELSANYTYLDSKNLSNASPIAMIYQPEHSANATLYWRPANGWKLYAAVNYVGEQYLAAYTNPAYDVIMKGYATWDIGGSYDLSDAITLRAGVLNVADKQIVRENTTEYNEDGRRVFFAVTKRF